jgi:hypothetical protein
MDKVVVVLSLLLISAIVWIGYLYDESERRHLFMSECQDDGFKHYQCAAAWRGTLVVMPMRAALPLDVN